MPVYLRSLSDGKEKKCVEPAALAKSCREIGLDTSWFGVANSYTCPLGTSPGYAHLLLRHSDIDDLLGDSLDEATELRYFDVVFASNTEGVGQEQAIVKNLLLLHAECLTPGARAAESVYLARLADKRYHLERHKTNVVNSGSFNLRHKLTGKFIQNTLRLIPGVSPPTREVWTWTRLVEALWDVSNGILGAYPGLPYTPAADPDDLMLEDLFGSEQLEIALRLIGCDLAYQPLTGEFRIVRRGEPDSAFEAAKAALDTRRVWDDYRRRGTKALTPPLAMYHVRRRGYYKGQSAQGAEGGNAKLSTGNRSPYSHFILRNPKYAAHFPPTEDRHRWPDTYMRFWLDMEEDWTGGVVNPVTERNAILARAEQLHELLFQDLEACADGMRVTYPFALSDSAMMPGPLVSEVRWAETGAGYAPYSGLITEVRKGGSVPNRPIPASPAEPPPVWIVRCNSTTPLSGTILFPGVMLRVFDGGPGAHYVGAEDNVPNGVLLWNVQPTVAALTAGRDYLGVYQYRHGDAQTGRPVFAVQP